MPGILDLARFSGSRAAWKRHGPSSSWLQSLPKPVGLMACNDDCGHQVIEACKLANLAIPDASGVVSRVSKNWRRGAYAQSVRDGVGAGAARLARLRHDAGGLLAWRRALHARAEAERNQKKLRGEHRRSHRGDVQKIKVRPDTPSSRAGGESRAVRLGCGRGRRGSQCRRAGIRRAIEQ